MKKSDDLGHYILALAVALTLCMSAPGCKKEMPWPTCDTDEDCVKDGKQYYCINGQCHECLKLSDCGPDRECLNYKCVDLEPPELPIAVKPIPPKKLKKEAVIELPQCNIPDVRFDFDKYDIRPVEAGLLQQWISCLRARGELAQEWIINGHCDERGTTEYNLHLGMKRAQETADFVVNSGLDSIPSVDSGGEESPICNDHCESCWKLNRRAEFDR